FGLEITPRALAGAPEHLHKRSFRTRKARWPLEVAWIRERCTDVASAAAVLRLNNHGHVAAIGQGPCEGHSTMLGLVTGQRTLPIGHDPIATHTLDYIDIIDWHSNGSCSRASARPQPRICRRLNGE